MSGQGKVVEEEENIKENHVSSINQEKKVKKKKRKKLYQNGYTTFDQPSKPLITRL